MFLCQLNPKILELSPSVNAELQLLTAEQLGI